MKVKALFVLYWASMTLAGCGSPPYPSSIVPAAPDLTGNWQIQSNVTPGINPTVGVVLFGALQSTGSQVVGTFRFANLSQPSTCGLDQVVAVTGSVDSKNNLALASSAMPNGTTIKALLGITGSQEPYAATGTIEVDGSTCTFPSTGATGEQIHNTTGTFSGIISPGTLVSPGTGPSGSGSLTITQSANSQSDGQFPATGSLNYAIGTCSGSIPLSGTVSGVGIILSGSDGAWINPQTLSIVATTNPGSTSISASFLDFVPSPCSPSSQSGAYYFGTLNRQ